MFRSSDSKSLGVVIGATGAQEILARLEKLPSGIN